MSKILKDIDPESGLVRFRIASPHIAEIPIPQREYLDFYISPPKDGINSDTIPVLVLLGYGEVANAPYFVGLHQSLAQKRNWLIITVNYIGARVFKFDLLTPQFQKWNEDRINAKLRENGLNPIDFQKIQGPHFAQELLAILQKLPSQLNTESSPLMNISLIPPRGEHFDSGPIQAIDCLWALKVLKQEYPHIYWDALTVSGSSHGGFLGILLAKLAPHTFGMVISADSYTQMNLAAALKEVAPVGKKQVNGIYYDLFREDYWTTDSKSPFYLSSDHRQIRNLRDATHLAEWKKQQDGPGPLMVMTQMVDDDLHPRKEKEDLVCRLGALGFQVEYFDKPDGIHRVLDQGLKKSLKGLVYDFLTPARLEKISSNRSDDFTRKSQITYTCQNGKYVIDYSGDFPVCCFKANSCSV